MKNLKIHLAVFLACTTLSFLIFMTIYAAVQQDLRQNANDPQIQIAEHAAVALESGQQIPSLDVSVDIGKSLSPFVIIYDEFGKVLTSNGVLDDKVPVPPLGVLENAKIKGENRVTWQPSINVRIAAVVTHFSGKQSGFVLAGRSLREVEKREDQTFKFAAAGWLLSVFVLTIAFAIFHIFSKK